MFRESAKELRKVQAIAICGVMGALAIVLGYVATIRIGDYIRVGFSFLPNVIIDFLFGPVVGGVFGGAMDIIKYLMNPTGPFFPGFTISGLLTGLIYGFALYKNQVTLPRVIIGWTINMLVVETFLAAFWLSVLNGYTADYVVYLSARFISAGIKCVPEILLIFFVGRLAAKINVNKRRA